jgi:UPF0755 protein
MKPKKKTKRRRAQVRSLIAKIVLGVLILLLLSGAGGVYFLYRTFLVPTGKNSEPIVLVIEEGQTLSDVAHGLRERGVIDRERSFITAARYLGGERRIRAGEYEIGPDMSPKDVLIMLMRGRVIEYTITIPEGLNVYQVADLLAQKGFADKGAFLALVCDRELIDSFGIDAPTLEGYLFPDTYRVDRSMKEKEIVTMMVDRFFVVFDEEKAKVTAAPAMTDRELLILASLVEKETSAPDERPLVAAVFVNRLKKEMKLDSCATVIYGIWDRFDGNLTERDLATPTPYNTYLNPGLPPGPICNPGRASIAAALSPADVDYLYFVSKNDGTSYFSSTLAEHNRAVYEYQILRKHRK